MRTDQHDAIEGGVADLDRAVGVEHALRTLDAPRSRLVAYKHEAAMSLGAITFVHAACASRTS